MAQSSTVFFDLGDTLVVPRMNAVGTLTALEPFPFVVEILAALKQKARLGIISNTPSGATVASMSTLLSAGGLLASFDPQLMLFSSVEGMDKTKKALFQLAATRAQMSPARCIFVGESAAERQVATSAGMKPAFHVLHVFEVLETIA